VAKAPLLSELFVMAEAMTHKRESLVFSGIQHWILTRELSLWVAASAATFENVKKGL